MLNLPKKKDIDPRMGIGEGGRLLPFLGKKLNQMAGGMEGFIADTVTLNGEAKTFVKIGADQLAQLLSDEVGSGEAFDISGNRTVTFSVEDNKIYLIEDENTADDNDVDITVEDGEAEEITDEVSKVRTLTESVAEVRGEYDLAFTEVYENGDTLTITGESFEDVTITFDESGTGALEIDIGDANTTENLATQVAAALNTQDGAGEISENHTITSSTNTVKIKEDATHADGHDIEVVDSHEDPETFDRGTLSIENESVAEVRGEYEILFLKMLEDGDKIKFEGDGFSNIEIDFDTTGTGDLEIDVGDFDDIPGMVAQIKIALDTEDSGGEIQDDMTATAEGFKRTITFEAGEVIDDLEEATVEEIVAFMQAAITEAGEDDEYWVEAIGSGESAQIKVYNLNPDLTESKIYIESAGNQNATLGFDDDDTDFGKQGIGEKEIEYDGDYAIFTQIRDAETGETLGIDDIESDGFSLICSTSTKGYEIDILTAGELA